MDARITQTVCTQIYRRFPEMRGHAPLVKMIGNNNLLIFQGSAKAANGQVIPRTVRVVVSPVGKILKITTSR